jgi:lipopolysaccharide/colanic/teichoic acid biosynthesis glycosyltransferase
MIVQRLAERDTLAGRNDLPLPAAVPVAPRRTASVGDYRSPVGRVLKRAVDLIAAFAVLALTAPLSFVVALLIKLEDGGPVLFRQGRVGLDGAVFVLRKFRSMRVDAEAETGPVWAQADDPRVTRVGRWLRLLHIDEIPQAWNVLRGEMSFVGPRPERPEFVGELRSAIPFYDYRHAVRPGITGWAQVHVRHTATLDDVRHKLAYDLDYLRNFSLRMDLAIMLRTLRIIFLGWQSR